MKEATGELNVTIIVVLAVGILIAFFYFTIWPGLNENFQQNSKCSKAYCDNNPCGRSENSCDEALNKLVDCKYKDSQGHEIPIKCPWKG